MNLVSFLHPTKMIGVCGQNLLIWWIHIVLNKYYPDFQINSIQFPPSTCSVPNWPYGRCQNTSEPRLLSHRQTWQEENSGDWLINTPPPLYLLSLWWSPNVSHSLRLTSTLSTVTREFSRTCSIKPVIKRHSVSRPVRPHKECLTSFSLHGGY